MMHDQNFKNLILDYPREAIALFAASEAQAIDAAAYLDFRFLAYSLPRIPAREHFRSTNVVARLNLPNMAYAPEEKLEVYAQAVRGLGDLEPDPERQLKYLDFIDIYAALDEVFR